MLPTKPVDVPPTRSGPSPRWAREIRRRVSRSTLDRARRGVATALVVPLAVACAADPVAGQGGQLANRAAGSGARTGLRGLCPSTVVVQSSWYPQVEHAAVYQLLGRGYRVDARRKVVTGPLVAHGGVDTGVRIEIRAGGPAIG